MCPKYWIYLEKKWHLLNFTESSADRCSSAVLLKIIILSRYAIAKLKSFKIPVINSWKYAATCANVKGPLTYSYCLRGELNAVFCIEDLSKRIWWCLALKSRIEKYFALFRLEKISSTFGTVQVNFLVTLFNALQSMTNHFPQSPFGTTIIGVTNSTAAAYDPCCE